MPRPIDYSKFTPAMGFTSEQDPSVQQATEWPIPQSTLGTRAGPEAKKLGYARAAVDQPLQLNATSRTRCARHIRAGLLSVASIAFGVTCQTEVVPRNEPPPLTRNAPSNGFGDAIAWQSLDEGIELAKQQDRPLMLVVHADWCQSCRSLKPKFASSAITDLSKFFVMVNIDQDKNERSHEFVVDGGYVPRILFLDPRTGKIDPALRNERRKSNRFYYGTIREVTVAMKKALNRYAQS